MQTVSLTWQQSFETAAVLAAVGGATLLSSRTWVRNIGALLRETAIIGVLYGLWHVVGKSAGSEIAAKARAQHIRNFEHYLPLPSEHWTQHIVLGHKFVVETANLYYASMHFTMMFVFLLWLFVRHRDHYRPIRRVLAWTTLGALLVQFIPVAPPRMFSDIVDTGRLYGQSVYSGGLAADQLSAMPSVHVAWAVLVGYYVWRVSPSRWRFIGPLHAALTIFVVVVTGNHWWADGIVGVALLVAASWWVHGLGALWSSLRDRFRGDASVPLGDDDPEPETDGSPKVPVSPSSAPAASSTS